MGPNNILKRNKYSILQCHWHGVAPRSTEFSHATVAFTCSSPRLSTVRKRITVSLLILCAVLEGCSKQRHNFLHMNPATYLKAYYSSVVTEVVELCSGTETEYVSRTSPLKICWWHTELHVWARQMVHCNCSNHLEKSQQPSLCKRKLECWQ